MVLKDLEKDTYLCSRLNCGVPGGFGKVVVS